jgi:hypothetical protein
VKKKSNGGFRKQNEKVRNKWLQIQICGWLTEILKIFFINYSSSSVEDEIEQLIREDKEENDILLREAEKRYVREELRMNM